MPDEKEKRKLLTNSLEEQFPAEKANDSRDNK